MVRSLPALSAIALLAAFNAVPAVAHADAASDESTQALRVLQDPENADRMADVLQGLTQALLAMPIKSFADAIARMDPNSALAHAPDDATLADITHADGDTAERLGDEARAAGYAMGDMSRGMETMLPVFQAMARDMAAQCRMTDARHRARRHH